MADADIAGLLTAAGAGDQHSWETIVDRFNGLVWSVARGFRLSDADAADITQATWLRLMEHLTEINDPSRLGGWLATTARREALGLLRRSGRDLPVADFRDLEAGSDPGELPDEAVLRADRDAGLWRAFSLLSAPCQQLLRVLLAEPPPSYADVSVALGLPVGSIGPTRARCLDTLRRHVTV